MYTYFSLNFPIYVHRYMYKYIFIFVCDIHIYLMYRNDKNATEVDNNAAKIHNYLRKKL